MSPNEDHDLIDRLKAARPLPVEAPMDFRNRLRTRLIAHYQAPYAKPKHWQLPTRWASVGVALLLILGLVWAGAQPASISAAEIVQRAAQANAVHATGSEIVYERAVVSILDTEVPLENAVAELWRSSDGTQTRYQLTGADGAILYFSQRNGDQIWRSTNAHRIGLRPATQVYLATSKNARANWGNLLLGINAHCGGFDCLFNKPGMQVTLQGKEQLADGRSVYAVTTQYTLDVPNDQVFTATLKIDAETYALVEAVEFQNGALSARLQQIERQVLAHEALAADFFSSMPPALTLLPQQYGSAAVGESGDRVRIRSITPAPSSILTGEVPFEIVVEYTMKSAPEGLLRFEFVKDESGRSVGFGTPVTVRADEHTAVVRFTANANQIRNVLGTHVKLAVELGHYSDLRAFNVTLWDVFPEYGYNVE